MTQAALALAQDRLTAFPRLLRDAGLPVEATRTADFLRAVRAVPLRALRDLRTVSRITLARSPEELRLHDAVFDAWFTGGEDAAMAAPPPDEKPAPGSRSETGLRRPELADGEAKGALASDMDAKTTKSFGRTREADVAARAALQRALSRQPLFESRRWTSRARNGRIDLAATCRAARATVGETMRLAFESREKRPRKLLLLIDVSGSMKAQSEIALRFAHALSQARGRVETFCFGTQLSRVTRALRHRDADAALGKLAGIVFDFDGGTRIGAALEEFLRASRYAALLRGADVLLISDGLETGDPASMASAVGRIARLSHRVILATPLAADPLYQPKSRALAACLHSLDAIADASRPLALTCVIAALPQIAAAPRGRAIRYPGAAGLLT